MFEIGSDAVTRAPFSVSMEISVGLREMQESTFSANVQPFIVPGPRQQFVVHVVVHGFYSITGYMGFECRETPNVSKVTNNDSLRPAARLQVLFGRFCGPAGSLDLYCRNRGKPCLAAKELAFSLV
jgi:hypothetical protein